MRKLTVLSAVLLMVFGCAQENKRTELFSVEAFAYPLDVSWELNVSARVKNFDLVEKNDIYSSSVNYEANFITPENDTIPRADFGNVWHKDSNEFNEMVIEMQVELDSAFTVGKYKVEIIASDENSAEKDTAYTSFELTEL